MIADANVLFSARVRDLLVQASISHLMELIVPSPIALELERVMVRSGRYEKSQAELIAKRLKDNFGTSQDRSTLISPEQFTTDKNDLYLVKLVLWHQPEFLVTNNLADFSDEIRETKVVSPDALACHLLETNRDCLLASLEQLRRRYSNPPLTRIELVDSLRRAQLQEFSRGLSSHFA